MTENSNIHKKYYPLTGVILGNLVIVLWIVLGGLSCALFVPLAAVPFFVLAAFLIFYEIGKHGCVTCYYCQNCTIGMGKLPDLFFRRDGTANVNRRALKLFPFVYLLLSVLPLAVIVISFSWEITVYKVVLFTAVLAFSLFTGVIRRQTILGRR